MHQTYISENINFEITGPIPSNYKKIFLNKDLKFICVFDVQPYNSWIRIGLGLTEDYYSFKNSKLFFNDLVEICNNLNVKILFKRKRFTKNIDHRYLNLIKELISEKKLVEVNSKTSIFEMIADSKSIGSIAMPFTSAGYIAENLNKINLFYDPSGSITNRKLINSKKELKSNLIKML